MPEQNQTSNNVTRHNVQVSEKLCKQAGHLRVGILSQRAAHVFSTVQYYKGLRLNKLGIVTEISLTEVDGVNQNQMIREINGDRPKIIQCIE